MFLEKEPDLKLKLQQQIEEKEKLLKQLQEQARLQQNIDNVNRQASKKTPQQQAILKRKLQTDQLKGEGNYLTERPYRKRSSLLPSIIYLLRFRLAPGFTL